MPKDTDETEIDNKELLSIDEDLSKTEEESNDSLIEEDGDFFWILQRVIWGIIKTLFLLGIIVALIWHIWWNDEISEKVKRITLPNQQIQTNSKTPKAKELPPHNKNLPINNNDNNPKSLNNSNHTIIHQTHSKNAASFIYSLENFRVLSRNSVFTESIKWLRDARGIADINLNFYISNHKTPQVAINALLLKTRELISTNGLVQSKLLGDMTEFKNLSDQEKQIALQLDQTLFEKISRLDSRDLDKLLNEKIKHEQLYIKYQSELKIRETLIKNMRGFERNLRKKVLYLVDPNQKTQIRSSRF